MEDLINRCHNHLKKEPNDIPIHRKYHLLEAVVTIRKSSSITQLSDDAGNLSKLLWSQLEQYDNWYHNDIILAGTLLSHMLSLDVIDDTAELILERLEKYRDYKRIQPTILSYFQSFAYFLLEQKQYNKSTFF